MKPDEALNKLFQAMHEAEQALAPAALQALVPADLKAKGWIYKDLPGRCKPEDWDLLLDIMGEGNYKILITSSGEGWKRGQFFLSPQAIENMRAYHARNSKA